MTSPTQSQASPIGFVVASHREPAQLLRLLRTLNRLYGDPPIVCHHDFGQCPLDIHLFPSNVRFVVPHVATAWAKWSVVEGVLRALHLLYQTARPEWFVVLSAADYPLARADHVLGELKSGAWDAYIDFRRVGAGEAEAQQSGLRNPRLWLSETDKGQRLGYQRYLVATLWIPTLRRKAGGGIRLGKISINLPFRSLVAPFRRGYDPYHGDFWFTGNNRAAAALLNPSKNDRKAANYLKYRTFPEESYFQTVLCNRPDLSMNRDNKRFSLWFEGADHPEEITSRHWDVLIESNAHFARKFGADVSILDALDTKLTVVDNEGP
jgi:hypothetical protein